MKVTGGLDGDQARLAEEQMKGMHECMSRDCECFQVIGHLKNKRKGRIGE